MCLEPPLEYLDLTLPTPAENLACDEFLLDACDAGMGGEVLRVWESPDRFVVVGYGNSVEKEVNRSVCVSRQVPILRRCTGGGTVVQGPGCLNYSLILRLDGRRPIDTITAANRFIMERNREALATVTGKPVEIRGHTDLAIQHQKFSGNAQRRRKNALLFHGSILLSFDLDSISALLPMPSKQPDYRKSRSHADFLMNLCIHADTVKSGLRKIWNATEIAKPAPREALELLSRDKYATAAWNLRF